MIKAIIEASITEDKYSVYNSIYDLKTLSEYYSKLPHTSKTKFVKFMRFTGSQAAVYNISDILITPNVADGSEGKKKVQIVYSGDEASKVWDVKKFSTVCKKIFNALKGVDEEDVEVESVLEGQNKPTKFRFYYDSDNGFAILVNGTNTKGLEEFLNNYEGDLENLVSVPKVTKAPKEQKEKRVSKGIKISKAPVKKNDHEGYVCVSSSDSFGHRIKIWKKDPSYKSPEVSQDKGEVKTDDIN